jgi:REP element-mobilizing transposase RayT
MALWLPGDERRFVGNVVEEPANDAIQIDNVDRAADASRRVSFNKQILINDNNILPLLNLTRRLASAARIRPMAMANYGTPTAGRIRWNWVMEADSWLLTWTTYGTWLPGDERGFVGNVVEEATNDTIQTADVVRAADASRRVTHNIPDTPYDRSMPGLRHYVLQQMRGEPVWIDSPQAELFLEEARRVAEFRIWPLLAIAVMANHAHLVVTAPKGIPGERLLQEFKSYGSRVLTRRFGARESGTWWTKSGSTRVLTHEKAVRAAVEYVRNQHQPLALWIADMFEPTM